MPSTITSYTTFISATKAKASQVNTNFSNHRGTLIPINEDTITASDLTHDLGSVEHRWRDAYLSSIDLEPSTSTSALVIQGQTSNTLGGMEFLVGGSVAGEILNIGCPPLSPNRILGGTTTAAWGGIAISGGTSGLVIFQTSSVIGVGTTLTISTTGRPVVLTMAPHTRATLSQLSIQALQDASVELHVYRDNSYYQGGRLKNAASNQTSTSSFTWGMNLGSWSETLYDLTAGTYEFHLVVVPSGADRLDLRNYKMIAYEI